MDSAMAAHSSQVYSEPYWRPITGTVQLLGLMALSSMTTSRLPAWKRSEWLSLTPTKSAILLILVDSLLFIFVGALFTLGIGTSLNAATCSGAIWSCIVFYASTKILISYFLIERVHIIHGQEEPRRWKNKIYLSNCVLLGLWLGVFVWLVIPHHTAIRPDGQCRFFVAPGASGAAGGLELFLNTYLSLLFAVPLYKGRWVNPEIRRLAFKSLVASVVCMGSSTTNLFIIAFVNHGNQLSWLCLTICTTDCLVNATILFVVTSNDKRSPSSCSSGCTSSSTPGPVLKLPTILMSNFRHRRTSTAVGQISKTVTVSELFSEETVEGKGREEGKVETDMSEEDDPACWRGDAARYSPTAASSGRIAAVRPSALSEEGKEARETV